MVRRIFAWLFSWLVSPSMARLEAHASEYGTLLLQQVAGPSRLYWTAQLRAHQVPGAPRYAWTADGDTLEAVIANAIAKAEESGAPKRIISPFAPRLGGAEFDE